MAPLLLFTGATCRTAFAILKPMRRQFWIIAGLIMALVVARLLPLPQNGTIGGLPSVCIFKNITGLPCPGCGLTRSVVYSAHGQWQQAITYHPFGPLFLAGVVLALVPAVISLRRPLNLYQTRAASILLTIAATAILILWVVRLSGIWPYPDQI